MLEDNHDVAGLLARLLGEEGYCVTLATRTADACELLERVNVDLFIADVLLPDGTCFPAVDIAKRKGVPYFLMTGCHEQMGQLRANGDFYVSKPFRLITFMDEVRSRIGPRDGGGSELTRIGGVMDYLKYLRDRAEEMREFALMVKEPASSEFFKLATLCRDSADRVERLSRGGRPWLVSRIESAPNPSEPRPSAAQTGFRQEDDASGERLPSSLPLG